MKRSLALVSGVIALSLGTQALAGTLTLNPSGPPGNAYGVNGGGYFIGLIPATYVDGPISKSFYAYCIDRELHSSWNSPYDTSTSQYFGPIPGEAGQIAYIANVYNFDTVLNTPPAGGVNDAAAAQMAIWIIRTGKSGGWITNWGLSALEARADAIVAESLNSTISENYLAARFTTSSSTVQDFVSGGETIYNSNQVVPEPFTMALGASCIGLALRRRKKS